MHLDLSDGHGNNFYGNPRHIWNTCRVCAGSIFTIFPEGQYLGLLFWLLWFCPLFGKWQRCLLGAFGPLSPIMKMFPTLDFTQSVAGIIIAQFYVASPFMILASEMAFESFDESYELMSRVLGKTRFETFIQVSVPLAKTGIIIGFIMSWVKGCRGCGATIMMAYNPHTISIQIFEDNAIGGLSRAIPDIFFSIILSVIVRLHSTYILLDLKTEAF